MLSYRHSTQSLWHEVRVTLPFHLLSTLVTGVVSQYPTSYNPAVGCDSGGYFHDSSTVFPINFGQATPSGQALCSFLYLLGPLGSVSTGANRRFS